MANTLFYGDNLEVLRKYIKDETVDLCYIDPPFNSKRNYNQIYNNIGSEDRAQAQAFVDTWVWDSEAIDGFQAILSNEDGRFQPQTVELIKGLYNVLKRGSLLAYLVSMTLRITEIFRVLKPTGSFYLHCDPTSSHYLKLVLDSVFVGRGGEFQNEIIWAYKSGGASRKRFSRKHDIIFFYSKSKKPYFKPVTEKSYMKPWSGKNPAQTYYEDQEGTFTMVNMKDWWQDIGMLSTDAHERMGYPTQKPEPLLERIINASCPDDGTVLDAYCGCGTTISVAQQLGRQWIGIDITYQSISLILRRLEGQFKDKWHEIELTINLNGIPRDLASAIALANKKDDRLRKEFEKWAILTYTNNRAIVNEKKGADAGIDGTAYFQTTGTDNASMIFQVKSGGVQRNDIATLRGDMERTGAAMATLITLQEPTAPMRAEAKAAGHYKHEAMGQTYDRIQIVTVREIVENNDYLKLPMSLEVLKAAQLKAKGDQLDLLSE